MRTIVAITAALQFVNLTVSGIMLLHCLGMTRRVQDLEMDRRNATGAQMIAYRISQEPAQRILNSWER
jgi:hypothetical protein